MRARTSKANGSNGTTERVQMPPLSDGEIEKFMRDAKEVVAGMKATGTDKLVISPPKMKTVTLTIKGLTPYVQHAFSQKARAQMEATQRAGQQARSRKTREARDFEANYRAAQHRSREGWCGIPASAFRNAMIDACRLVGFKMTLAKLSVFVEADGFDEVDSSPLVKITKGEPEIHKGYARNASGVADLRWRPLWAEGWEAQVTLRWDADQFAPADIFNLMLRAGLQVGIGEGRPNSPNSNGLGWGIYTVEPGYMVVDEGSKAA